MQPLDYTVSGPLTGHGHPFADYLQYLGYAPTSIGLRLNLLRHFSNWLTTHCPSPNQCDDTVLDKYYQQRATELPRKSWTREPRHAACVDASS